MTDDRWRRVWTALGIYAFWLVSAALTVADVLTVRRFLLRVSVAIAERGAGLHHGGPMDHWTVAAVDQFGLLVLGATGLIFVLICEGIYTRAAARRHLWRRFAVVTAVQVGLLALGLV